MRLNRGLWAKIKGVSFTFDAGVLASGQGRIIHILDNENVLNNI